MTMKEGICRNCGENNVYKQDKNSQTTQIRLTKTQVASPAIYICASCGYVEQYMTSEKAIDILTSSDLWSPVKK